MRVRKIGRPAERDSFRPLLGRFSLLCRVISYAAFLVLPAWSQITLLQVKPCADAALGSSPCPISASGSGNLLVVGVRLVGTTAAVAAINDDVGNQYTQAVGSRSIDTIGGSSIDIWYARNSLAGATNVTVTPSSTVIGAAVVWEFSGVDPVSPFDQAATLNSQSPALSVSAPALRISAANGALVSISAAQNTIVGQVSDGFTNDTSVFGGGWAHRITSAVGVYAPTWAESSLGTYASSTVSFKAANTSCDVNGDGAVNVVDVQLVANMESGAPGFSCSVNVGGILGCTESARQVVIKAALGQGCHFLNLNWDTSPSVGVVGYNIYRGTSPGGESSTPLNTGGPVTGTSFTDVSAISGTTYYYRVKATDGVNLSPPSQEVFATAY